MPSPYGVGGPGYSAREDRKSINSDHGGGTDVPACQDPLRFFPALSSVGHRSSDSYLTMGMYSKPLNSTLKKDPNDTFCYASGRE